MEQKAAHTPAPWRFEKLAMHYGGNVVMFTVQNGQRTHRLDCAGEFKEADAHLIAAAPELLEACRLVEKAQRDGDYMTAFLAVRAAITKAKGGAA